MKSNVPVAQATMSEVVFLERVQDALGGSWSPEGLALSAASGWVS